MVFAGMDADVPAGLKHVNDRLHADIELRHPHHPHVTLWILHKAHLSARLQRNTCEDKTERRCVISKTFEYDKGRNMWYKGHMKKKADRMSQIPTIHILYRWPLLRLSLGGGH